MDDETLKKALVAAGHAIERGCEFTTKEIVDALAYGGNLQRERIANARLDRERKERDAAVDKGELLTPAKANEIIDRRLIPLVDELKLAPALADQCNPDNPAIAETALKEWVQRVLKKISQ